MNQKFTITSSRAGMTLIELLVSVVIMLLLMAITLPAIGQARAAANRITCVNNLKQIGIALHLHHDSLQRFPAGRGVPAPKIFSPQAALLPYVEQSTVHSLLNFDAPPADYTAGPIHYDGSRNLAAARLALPLFLCPASGNQVRVTGSQYGGTNYVANAGSGQNAGSLTGADGLFYLGSAIRLRDIQDGTTYTAAFSERLFGEGSDRNSDDAGRIQLTMREIPAAADPVLSNCDDDDPGSWNHERGAKWIVGNYGNTLYNHALVPNANQWDCLNMSQQKARMAVRSRHSSGVNVLLCDGHVQFINDTVGAPVWNALATRASAEAVATIE